MKTHTLLLQLVGLATTLLLAGCSKPPTPPAAESPRANVSAKTGADFFSALAGQLVVFEKGVLVPYVRTGPPAAFTAIYFSAHWCPPCRIFTPQLVDWYRKFKASYPNFELVFASSDEDEAAMLNYMKETNMPWPAVKFGEKKAAGLDKYAAGGIPYLVLIDENGKDLTGKENNDWQPPTEVFKKIEELVK